MRTVTTTTTYYSPEEVAAGGAPESVISRLTPGESNTITQIARALNKSSAPAGTWIRLTDPTGGWWTITRASSIGVTIGRKGRIDKIIWYTPTGEDWKTNHANLTSITQVPGTRIGETPSHNTGLHAAYASRYKRPVFLIKTAF